MLRERRDTGRNGERNPAAPFLVTGMVETGSTGFDGELPQSNGQTPQSMTQRRGPGPSPVTIPVAFVNGMLSGVIARGMPPGPYLEDAGIAPELLANAAARVTADQYVALFRSLSERLDDIVLGFLSRPLRRGSLAMILRSGASARTLDVAIRRTAHAFNLLQDDLVIEPVREGSLAGGSLRFTDPSRQWPVFVHELLLRAFWRLNAWLAGGRLPAARFDFAYPPPPYAAAYAAVFPGVRRFERAHSAFLFEVRHLQGAVRRDDRAIREFLTYSQASVIVPRADADAVSARLRELLQRSPTEWPTLAACAQALHMSPATLQRHLAREGATFQSLKDDLRRDVAIHRLNTSSVTLAALAGELGFADSASFQRAFKKWTGSAPGPYRGSRT